MTLMATMPTMIRLVTMLQNSGVVFPKLANNRVRAWIPFSWSREDGRHPPSGKNRRKTNKNFCCASGGRVVVQQSNVVSSLDEDKTETGSGDAAEQGKEKKFKRGSKEER